VVPPDVAGVGGDACREEIGAPGLLKLSRYLPVVNPGVIPAVAADQLVQVGIATFWLAVHDAAWLTPQDYRPAMPRLAMVIHV
jgi:hypothetical protein